MAARKRLSRWLKAVLMALAVGLMVTGCWNNQPVEHREMVLAIGVKPASHHGLEVLLQVPSKEGLIQIPGASGAGGGSSGTDYYVLKGVGHTFAAALADAQNHTDRELFVNQAQLLLFSSHLSGAQFYRVLDSAFRMGTIDKNIWVADTGSVTQALNFAPKDSKHIPALYFTTVFNCSTCANVRLSTRLWDVYQDDYSKSRDISMPYVTVGKTNFTVDRLAVYQNGRIQDILTPGQSVALGWAMGLSTRATLAVQGRFGTAVIRDLAATTRHRLRTVQGRPHETITVSFNGELSQVSGTRENLFQDLPTVERLASQQASREITAILSRLQQKGLDPMGFSAPYVWRDPAAYPTRASVRTLYRHLTIQVRTTTRLSNLGGKT